MAAKPSTPPTAYALTRGRGRLERTLIVFALAFGGTLLLALSARTQVPFFPVPMTLQTFAVMLIGAAYGWRLAGATMLLYLAEGALGFPVFANTPERGIGLAYMLGPTGGYLAGFTLAAMLLGAAVARGMGRSLGGLTALMALAMVPVYGFGAAWLAQFTGLREAVATGITPFLLGDAVKIALAASCVQLGRRWLNHA